MKVYSVYYKSSVTNSMKLDRFFDERIDAEAYAYEEYGDDGRVYEESFAKILNEMSSRINELEENVEDLSNNTIRR
ncbi:MAG: hypothetical protein MJZ34_05415 [Paludibacteraceae bacterium]|nr:hypothetical protein [Paludibacteraceae bacterium]